MIFKKYIKLYIISPILKLPLTASSPPPKSFPFRGICMREEIIWIRWRDRDRDRDRANVEEGSKMNVIDTFTRVDVICEKYEK